MQRKQLITWILGLVCLAVVPMAADAAKDEPQETGQYLVYLSEDPGAAGNTLTAVPYAEGYYTADSLLEILPLMAEGAVDLVVRNERLELLDVPDDPDLSSQWYLESLGMDELWDKAYTGEGVTVAVIDSGLYSEHEEFADTTITGHNFLGSGDQPDAYGDDSGHGTLVTGVLAAGRDNGVGGAGLTPRVSVMALRCFASGSGSANSGNGSLDTVLSAIGWAIENHADVINMSLGGTNTSLQAMEPILNEAADAGILTVAAAGNRGGTMLYYPAAFDCVTGVGWTDSNDVISSSSQHNSSVYVSAPGSGIYGPGIQSSNDYRSDSGTSFSTPMVSALAVMAKQTDKEIDHSGFQELLRLCAEDRGDEGWDEYYGYGVISASAFVTALETPQRIVYQCGEGAVTTGNWPQTYLIGHGADVTLPGADAVTLNGNTFAGWYLSEEFTGEPLTSIPAGSVGEVTLYAKWDPVAAVSEISGLTVHGVAATKTGSDGTGTSDWTVLLPREQREVGLTAADIILSFQNGESAAADGLTILEETEGLWQVNTTSGIQILQVNYSSYATPAPVQSAKTGTAAPASRDGETVAVPFTALLTDMFSGASEDTIYSIDVGSGTGSVDIQEGTLCYVPTAADAGGTVSLIVQAVNPDGFSGGTVSVTITVGEIPPSDSRLVTQSIVYHLNEETEDCQIILLPYGNTLLGVSCGTSPLQVETDYSLSSQAELEGQMTCVLTRNWLLSQEAGEYSLTFLFDNGRTEAGKSLVLPLTIQTTVQTCSVAFYSDETLFETVVLESGSPLLLPSDDPKKTGYTFDGWYTAQSGGQTAPVGTPVTEDAAYYAHWKKTGQADGGGGQSGGGAISGGGGAPSVEEPVSNTIRIPEELENAVVDTDHTSAKTGDIIILTVTPNEGYRVEQVKVTDINGGEIQVTDHGDGTYSFKMPATGVEVYPIILEDEEAPLADSRFLDVPQDAYYAAAVAWAVDRGVTTGKDAYHFGPTDACTRAQMVTLLWRAAGEPVSASDNPFSDVSPDTYYYQAVLWAVEKGITNGTDDIHFTPDAIVTRGQSVTFLYRFAGREQAEGALPFSDVPTSAYCYDAVLWAVGNGITQGTTTSTFSPNDICNRAQIVTFLYRFFGA